MLLNLCLLRSGWILGQLVPGQQRGTQHSRVMTGEQRKLLEGARTISREAVMDEINGLWCDALPMLVCAEWPAAKRGITGEANAITSLSCLPDI